MLLGAACSSEKATPDGQPGAGGEGASAGSSGSSGGTAGRPTQASCPKGQNPRGDAQPVPLGSVSGQIVDEQDQPTSSGLVQICGRDICINARVGSNGKLAEAIDKTLDTPACKWGDGFDWAKLALPLDAGDSDLGTLTAVRLPDYADSVPLEPATSASSGGVTLTLDAKAAVVVNTLDYETQEQQGLRAVELTGAALTQLGQDFVEAFALSPLETRICPSPSLSLSNSAELAPGTELELYLLGLDVDEAWAPYGRWLKIGEGSVSEDGQSLDFPDGVPLLTAVGVKVRR
jgi:hypothetical protein